jgi:O-succinylbenzoic acid--CoA ligase
VLGDVLAGRTTVLPVSAEDAPGTSLLTTTLGAGDEIDDDVAVVVSTSGTTGTPKGAMLTASALTASAQATHRRLGGDGQWLLALSAHHIAGLQVLVRSVVAGTTPVAVAASFSAAELVSAVAAMGSGRRYVSLVATQLSKALQDPGASAALASFDAVLIGGGPMPAGIAERATAAGVSVVRTYGMSETAGGCVYDGIPLDGVDVRIDAGAGSPATSGGGAGSPATSGGGAGSPATSGEGRIVLGGPTLAKGYRNAVSPDPFADPGWFRTDDVGAIESGVLRVLGRADDAISTGGLTVSPQLVEAALTSHASVAECAVFGVTDDRLGQRVVAAVVVAPDSAVPTLAELRAHVATTLEPTAAPREIHLVDEIPRRGIGKVDRRGLIERFG